MFGLDEICLNAVELPAGSSHSFLAPPLAPAWPRPPARSVTMTTGLKSRLQCRLGDYSRSSTFLQFDLTSFKGNALNHHLPPLLFIPSFRIFLFSSGCRAGSSSGFFFAVGVCSGFFLYPWFGFFYSFSGNREGFFFILLFQDFFFKRRILRIYGSGSFGIFPRFLDRISPPPPSAGISWRNLSQATRIVQDRSGSFFFCRTSYLAESSVFGVEGNSVLSGSFRIVQDCQDRFSNFQKKDFLFSWIRSVFCLDSRREFFPMLSGSFRIAQDRSGQWVCCQGGGSRICRQDFSWIPRRCRNRSTSIRIIQDRWGSFRIAQDS